MALLMQARALHMQMSKKYNISIKNRSVVIWLYSMHCLTTLLGMQSRLKFFLNKQRSCTKCSTRWCAVEEVT